MGKNVYVSLRLSVFVLLTIMLGCSAPENRAYTSSELEKIVRDDPKHCFNNEQLGAAYMMEGYYEKAIPQYEMTLQMCPDDPLEAWMRDQLGMAYVLTSNLERGYQEMDRAIELARLSGNVELHQSLVLEKEAMLERFPIQ